ncbi:TetR family transcriptional regulator [Heyndrickxia sp. NPDC080065]|uniref:acyl-CoA-like ligand-binding transcription factor n=1 Tax=Heyndrickxia sp. NPDC080065 TaxID=3390568 RepID=UPI003D0039C0
MSTQGEPKPSLRERKKAKTRATIQKNAIRLFREQGYLATTVEQIAEVSEISPSTFFRYFPTKESVVLEDDYDPLLIESYKQQPPELSPIQALRGAVREGLSKLTDVELETIRERVELSMKVPELRAASVIHLSESTHMIANLVAERIGRDKSDVSVITFAGAVTGTISSIFFYCAQNPEADFLKIIDDSLMLLEKGLSL